MVTDSGRPPHRSRRAVLPHRAPTSSVGAKAVERPWMLDSGRRQPAIRDVRHPSPIESMPLAPLAELAAPGADDLRADAVYGVAVGRDRVIREVSADDRAKPSTLLVDGVMTTPRKNRLESLER